MKFELKKLKKQNENVNKFQPNAHHKTPLHSMKVYNTRPSQFCKKRFLFFFRPLSSVHLFQSNQLFQAIELVDQHVLEKL